MAVPQVVHASLASLGGAKALPYLVMFAASNAGGWAGDYLINTRRRGVGAGRKLVNTAGFWSAAVALMLMPGVQLQSLCCSQVGSAAAKAGPEADGACIRPSLPVHLPIWLPCAAPLWHPGARSVGAGVAFTTLALGCAGFSRGGFSVNHMDIAPKYAGVVM